MRWRSDWASKCRNEQVCRTKSTGDLEIYLLAFLLRNMRFVKKKMKKHGFFGEKVKRTHFLIFVW
jgi:hypothetical protein